MKPNQLIDFCLSNKRDGISGIYMIICIPNNVGYIGQSKNIERRWKEHKSDLKRNTHDNEHLQRSYNKYGKDCLFFTILETDIENITEKEGYYVNLLDKENLFNTGQIIDAIKFGEQTKKKISSTLKGRPSHRKGKKLSPETCAKMSEARKRQVGTKKHSELTKLKIGAKSKGRIHSLETRQKMSEQCKKYVMTPEHKEKLTAINKEKWLGKNKSMEVRRKISETLKQRNLNS